MAAPPIDTLYILDAVLRDAAEITTLPPERGGALLGLPNRPVLVQFLQDSEAETSAISFTPSRVLGRRVQDAERTQGLRFYGVLHSQPGRMDAPSPQDTREAQVGLELNPHLPGYYLPIATTLPPEGLEPHEVACGSGKLSFYVALREGRASQVYPVPVRVVPLFEDLTHLAARYGSAQPPAVFAARFGGMDLLVGQVLLGDGQELLLLATEHYPLLPPLLLVTRAPQKTEQLPLAWRLDVPDAERLLVSTEPLLGTLQPPRAPVQVATPPSPPSFPLSLLPPRPWRALGVQVLPPAERLKAALFARSVGLLSPALGERHVALFGLGSVGSYLAEQLVRSGVGRITLVDPDTVEPANLARTVYTIPDLGQTKPEALKTRLLAINPRLYVRTDARAVADLGLTALHDLIANTDLVVAATDTFAAQRAVNHLAYALQKPSLSPALYARAEGGEVVVSVPPRSACFLCATRVRAAAPPLGPTNYGTGRLDAEVGLSADIHHLSSAAVKLALALLMPASANERLSGFLEPQIAAHATYLTFSMAPDYWFYPALFGQVPGQYAYQAVWLTVRPAAECPICGADAYRSDWREIVLEPDTPAPPAADGPGPAGREEPGT